MQNVSYLALFVFFLSFGVQIALPLISRVVKHECIMFGLFFVDDLGGLKLAPCWMRSVHVLYVVTNIQWFLIECYVRNMFGFRQQNCSNSDTFCLSEYSFWDAKCAFTMTVFEYCVLNCVLDSIAATQQLVATCYIVYKEQDSWENKRPMHQCRHQRQVQQSPLVLSGMMVESLRTSEQNGKSSTHPGRQLRGNCCILLNFKRLLVPDCPGNELLPSSHIMGRGKEFTWRDAVSTVRSLAAGVSDCSRTKAQCL